MKKKLYYIEVALNGTVVTKKQLRYNKSFNYNLEDIDIYDSSDRGLTIEIDGEVMNYGERYCGDFDAFEEFLKTGVNPDQYDGRQMITKDGTYLETWLTERVGWFDDRYVGVMIDK